MFDEYFNPSSSVVSRGLPVVAPQAADTIGTPLSTSIDQDAPSIIRLMMDDPNITMEEYIKLQAEKAQRHFEVEFPAIVYNDALTSNENVLSKPPVSIYNEIKADIDFSISFSDFEDEDYTFICDKDFSLNLHAAVLSPSAVLS
ncbi:hypothetical protein Tco_0320703 [Tanacetum coccineum]